MLADAAAVLGDRPAAVARELTKMFETVRRGTVGSLASAYGGEPDPKGEIVVLIGPPDADTAVRDDPADLDERLRRQLGALSVKDAVDVVSQETGLPRKRVYARAVALKSD